MIVAVAGLYGLLFGSFANVLIARVPAGKGSIRGRSACPTCDHEIRWFDNVPLVSWLMLRGRCRDCRAPISWHYPAVELGGAALGVLVGFLVERWSPLIVAMVMIPVSLALVVIDVRHRRLPHPIVLGAAVSVAVVAAADAVVNGPGRLGGLALGVVIMGGFYGLQWLVMPRGLGFGDVTTGALLGGTLGFMSFPSLAVGAVAGPLCGGVAVALLAVMGRLRRGATIPYGPALIAGAWIGILAGDPVARWYLALFGVG